MCAQVQCLMRLLLAGVAFLRDNWVLLMRKPMPIT